MFVIEKKYIFILRFFFFCQRLRWRLCVPDDVDAVNNDDVADEKKRNETFGIKKID